MLEKILEKNKEFIIEWAMKTFLKEGDKSLIAWIDENGKPKCRVFKFDILKKIEEQNEIIKKIKN